MNPLTEHSRALNRRQFFKSSTLSLGGMALSGLWADRATAGLNNPARDAIGGIEGLRSVAPKAKRVIFLFQSGGPAQMDLFDPKPQLRERFGEDLPDSARQGRRLTNFTKNQKTKPIAPSMYDFPRHGQSGIEVSELLPHIGSVADDICFIRSIHGEAINHDPARMLIQTGSIFAGRPSMGSWLTYGLGNESGNLPSFMVLNSYGSCKRTPQPVNGRLWSSGFLPSQYQGVKLQSTGDPILYVSNPGGIDRQMQGGAVDAIAKLNRIKSADVPDPEIEARIRQYEMAFRMQASVPDLLDIRDEPASTFGLYGEGARQRGTYAANCLLARRMAERGVRFIQLYHVGWDHHQNVPRDLPLVCGDIDQATAGLIKDLKSRGMYEDTLIVFGGEFGRTVFCQGKLTKEVYGRDHHPYCFTMWLAGGGIKPGMVYGATDDFSYNIAENPVHIHDLQATIMHQLGIEHTRLTYKFQGREYRLTDIHGNLVRDIVA